MIEDALPGFAAAQAAKMRVTAIPDRRFVDPSQFQANADYSLRDLSEVPALIRKLAGNK